MGRYDDEYEYDYGIDDIEDIVDEYEDYEDYDSVDEDYNTQSDWENYYHNLAEEIGDD